jgi:hypothetical protein
MNNRQRSLTAYAALLFLGTLVYVPRMVGAPEYLRWSVVFDEPIGRTLMNEVVEGYHTNYKVLCIEWGIMAMAYVSLFQILKTSPKQPRVSN